MKLYEIRDNFIPIIKYALTLEDVITSNNCSFPTKKIDEKEMKKVKQIMEAL
jgi:dihydrodipicolinate synthase/N-acetylneuraminate lyase